MPKMLNHHMPNAKCQTFKCQMSNVQMPNAKCSSAKGQMFKCQMPNVQMPKTPMLKTPKRSNAQMPNAHMHKSSNTQLLQRSNVKVFTNVRGTLSGLPFLFFLLFVCAVSRSTHTHTRPRLFRLRLLIHAMPNAANPNAKYCTPTPMPNAAHQPQCQMLHTNPNAK